MLLDASVVVHTQSVGVPSFLLSVKSPVGSPEFGETIRQWMMWLIHAADVRVPTANAKEPQPGYAPEAVEATPAATQRSRSQARALAAPSIVDAKVEELKRGTQPGVLSGLLY